MIEATLVVYLLENKNTYLSENNRGVLVFQYNSIDDHKLVAIEHFEDVKAKFIGRFILSNHQTEIEDYDLLDYKDDYYIHILKKDNDYND